MSDIMQITLLPAKEGDCMVIAYGDDQHLRHILIDAGRAWTYKHALKKYLYQQGITALELVVVTHVDRDHIDGMVRLFRDPDLRLDVKDVWFNTWDHLHGKKIERPEDDDLETFGAKMGETLSTEIMDRSWNWNHSFGGAAVVLDEPDIGNVIEMGDIQLTLLSPDRDQLEALIPKWQKECQAAGITPGYTVKDYVISDDEMETFGTIDIDRLADEPFAGDDSSANGSSIAFMLEYKNKKILLAGDAHTPLLTERLKQLGASKEAPVTLNAFKISHHGSKYNISKELLDMVQCDHYLISTNGNYFKHPDEVAMARIIKYGTADATLHFNYKTEFTDVWENSDWQRTYHYKTRYPLDNQDGYITLDL